MSDVDLDALEEVAQAANKPWHPWGDETLPERTTAAEWADDIRRYLGGAWGDLAAALYPPTVLTLIERVRVAEAAVARVEALADGWSEVPPYLASDYDRGRVEQRQMCESELRAALPTPTPESGTVEWECGPHANAWNGHDARCRRVTPRRSGTDEGSAS